MCHIINILVTCLMISLSLSTTHAIASLQPLMRPVYTPPSDSEFYRQIFRLQNNKKWSQTDATIRRLEDTDLLGHVYWQRYMHPTAYRATWQELHDWLKHYSDHPRAWQVYKLAKKRKPKNAKMPKAPPKRIWFTSSQKIQKQSKLFRKSSTRYIRRKIKKLIQKERPTQAYRYITQPSIDRKLTAEETDYLRSYIARSYYIEGKIEKSLSLAQQATRSRHVITLSDWQAGLAAWRLNNLPLSLIHFTTLVNNTHATHQLRSAAAFWASRTNIALGHLHEAIQMLDKSANFGDNHFYGLLAKRQLDSNIYIQWHHPTRSSQEKIIEHSAVQRSLKLKHADQQALAELELLHIHNKLSQEEQQALLSLSIEYHFPAVEFATTRKLITMQPKMKPHQIPAGLFPLPTYQPTHGYKLDHALIFALIRQESQFKAKAKSFAGARGLMQIMPSTAAFITGNRKLRYRSGRDDLYHISTNLNIGQTYLQNLLTHDKINHNLIYTLSSYNAGPGNVRRWRKEINHNDPLLFIESIPAPETRGYIKKVLSNFWLYRSRFGQKIPSLDQIASGQWPLYQSLDKNKSLGIR